MKAILSYIILFSLFALACNSEETAYQKLKEEKAQRKKQLSILSRHAALPLDIPSPPDNPMTDEKIELGRLLFFDPILSGDRDVACATCHHPDHGYAEFRDISIGVNGQGFGSKRTFRQPNEIPFVKRNAHTILNTAYNGIQIGRKYDPEEAPMFWDNRTKSLELQALEPIQALEEMRGLEHTKDVIIEEIVDRLAAIPEYKERFSSVFGHDDPMTATNLGKAIAAFERTLVTNNSRFDRYLRGEENAISLSEKGGYELFKKVGCANCHNGPMFSDFKMHVLGVPENPHLTVPDSGFQSQFAFRTPTLRNLRFTAPYMHNGTLKDLQSVLEFYEDISFGKVRNPLVTPDQYDELVEELDLAVRDMGPIISFLNTLNEPDFDREIPAQVPSGLPVGGDIH